MHIKNLFFLTQQRILTHANKYNSVACAICQQFRYKSAWKGKKDKTTQILLD